MRLSITLGLLCFSALWRDLSCSSSFHKTRPKDPEVRQQSQVYRQHHNLHPNPEHHRTDGHYEWPVKATNDLGSLDRKWPKASKVGTKARKDGWQRLKRRVAHARKKRRNRRQVLIRHDKGQSRYRAQEPWPSEHRQSRSVRQQDEPRGGDLLSHWSDRRQSRSVSLDEKKGEDVGGLNHIPGLSSSEEKLLEYDNYDTTSTFEGLLGDELEYDDDSGIIVGDLEDIEDEDDKGKKKAGPRLDIVTKLLRIVESQALQVKENQ